MDNQIHVPALLAEVFAASRSEARRVMAQGGIKLNGEQLEADMSASELNGELTWGKSRTAILKNGKVIDD